MKEKFITDRERLISELAAVGKWEEFSLMVQGAYEVIPFAFEHFYKNMPEKYRRDFVIGCYEHHGDSVGLCMEAVKALPKNGKNELPEGYKDLPYITVYRADDDLNEEELQSKLAWTLDLKAAAFFKYVWHGGRDALYMAKIRPEDVIAYNNNRSEQEVIQFGSVYDIENFFDANWEDVIIRDFVGYRQKTMDKISSSVMDLKNAQKALERLKSGNAEQREKSALEIESLLLRIEKELNTCLE